MANLTVPMAPPVTVMINNAPVGAVQYYSEKTERDVQILRSVASGNPQYHIGKDRYTLHLRYILPMNLTLADATVDLYQLHDFSLRINVPKHIIYFRSCEYASVEMRCDVSGSVVCEAVIYALERDCIAEE